LSAPQLGLHAVWRCEVQCWYVLAGQAEQLRSAVLESALIFWPAPQKGCS
jgi:hypothetical protein